ncbi:hypothetical protein SAMD00024442_3_98 [Candidatus Symbiothrix dinenymphae]|nr:hypothetical protein SAMD00024442_3_98 [Candidatus Symbiothrix dinenymphae]
MGQLSVTSYQLPVIGEQLSVIGGQLSAVYSAEEKKTLARLILQFVCNTDLSGLLRNNDVQLTENEVVEIQRIIGELNKNRPIQYILGETEFYGLKLAVDENVLIPRPETEELVQNVIAGLTRNPLTHNTILDIGTGSGCIAIALAKHLPEANVYALDISPKALHIAKKNAETNQANIHFFQHNILSPKPFTLHSKLYTLNSTLYTLIISNPPYITPSEKAEMQPNVLNYEPHEALFVPENEPLLFYERIAMLGQTLLTPDGQLFFEINARFGQEIAELLHRKGYSEIHIIQDISKKDRFIQALWKNQ